MKLWQQLLKTSTWEDLFVAAGIALLAFFVAWLVRNLMARFITRPALAADVVRATRLWLLAPLALYAGAATMELPARLDRLLESIALVALVMQFALWATRLLSRWLSMRAEAARGTDPEVATTVTLLGFVGRVVVWSFALLLGLDQLGLDVTALVAGLGIGGIAVALALQNILGDLFASAAIVLDKPFMVGDFIVVGDRAGSVEKVGLKTTRVRSLSGEQLVFSNTQLLNSQIRNFKRMQERRIAFGIGVTYETPLEKLREIPAWLKAAVEAQPKARFDRAHFKEYADFSLNFEIVYYVLSPEYNVYMDTQQAINFALFEKLAAEGVQFAYPTRTLFIKRGGDPGSVRSEA
ncbi:MAG TPA: mechanosensitive ion channel family protein [Burkholderiales bacterium]|nr:mechanosensitive ion channel family protein [Burkholderiales bacterium]